MNASLIEILDKFLVVIWPMLRLSAFLAFTSIFSARAVNMRIRISLAFAMSFFVTQYIEIPKIDPVTADGLMEIFRQILIGFTMGLVFQVASAHWWWRVKRFQAPWACLWPTWSTPTWAACPCCHSFSTSWAP
jgi:ethanolamine transporter EutH